MLDFQGLPIPHVLSAIILTALYAVADRRWGDDDSFKGEKAAILLILTLVGFAVGGLTVAIVGVIWVAYRSFTKPFKGSTTNWRIALPRHAVILILVLPLAYLRHESLLQAGLAYAAYISVAVALAARYGALEAQAVAGGKPIGGFNRTLEKVRGASHGLAAFTAFILQFGPTQ